MPRPQAAGPVRTERVIYGWRGRRPPDVLTVRIGHPEPRAEGGWQCRIHCPAVLGRDLWSVGADAAQARALAAGLVADLFDCDGYVVSPRQWPVMQLAPRPGNCRMPRRGV